MRVEGVVFKVYEKAFRGQTNYSIKIDGDPLYYRANTNRWAGIAEPAAQPRTFPWRLPSEMSRNGKAWLDQG